MKGKEWEKICKDELRRLAKLGQLCWGSYGVKAYMDPETKQWRPKRSLPDIEGILPGGRQWMFDCKVVSQSSWIYESSDRKSQLAQKEHMMDRSKFGGIGFFLVHFPERVLDSKSWDQSTWAVPVNEHNGLWLGSHPNTSRLHRDQMHLFAHPVEWGKFGRSRTLRPDIMQAIKDVGRLENHQIAKQMELC